MAVDGSTFVSDYIDKSEIFYMRNSEAKLRLKELRRPLSFSDVFFVKMKSITFEDKAPRKEALVNVLSAMRLPGINFLYLIRGEKQKVSFYYGISRDLVLGNNNKAEIDLSLLGNSVLRRSLEGNFRGSSVSDVSPEETSIIINELQNFKHLDVLEGVPGSNNDEAADFQRVDRLIDVMLGDKFMFLVIAKSLHFNALNNIEANVFDFYQKLVPVSKKSLQRSNTDGLSETKTETKGYTKGTNNSTQHGTSSGTSVTSTDGGNNGQKTFSKSNCDNSGESHSSTQGDSESWSNSVSDAKGTSQSKSNSESIEIIDKKCQDWMQYVDDSTLKRLDYGKGKGVFLTTTVLLSDDNIVLQKLVNTSTSLFSGQENNKVPLCQALLNSNAPRCSILRSFQIPLAKFVDPINVNEVITRTVLSQYVTTEKAYVANWYSVNDLSLIAGLPRKEVVGLSLNEEVEFGLNYNANFKEEFRLPLGSLVQSGDVHQDIEISLDKRDLTKHIFVCGVTGSGKTTTCMSILQQSYIPFLVIEPAKTEYRILANQDNDLVVFTLGRDDIAPFRLNPLEFLPSETISSHVDMVKASIEAAFEMEAAIPQIIESSLYECYKKCGWDIATSTNNRYEDPFADGVFSFPTLDDLIKTTEIVVSEQGFDERLKNDYLGSIRARLLGLVVGAKGLMLNTKRSIDFRNLVHKKVVIELENIRSGSEKSLIMGFILSNLCEAIKDQYRVNPSFRHITLVEEAHRLLSKYTPGDSFNKKNGVETFADMLAEIRKYGESLIIADQIPDKMTPDVLKNTNTKIVHKIFAQDDKEAIGNTMSLTTEQKAFLSNLVTGRAVVFSQGWEKSIQVQIKQLKDTTTERVEESKLHDNAMKYIASQYKKGIFPELSCLESQPSKEKTSVVIKNIHRMKSLATDLTAFLNKPTKEKDRLGIMAPEIATLLKFLTIGELSKYLNYKIFLSPDEESKRLIHEIMIDIQRESIKIDEFFLNKYYLIINCKSKH